MSSGKGGVGKTTFAVNFALNLSRHKPTVLVDLDTGTSSVRSALPVEPDKDLYHVKKKGAKLTDCITRLPDRFDPHGRHREFGFIASPRNFIQEIANPTPEFRRSLSREINHLPAEYVVLDLRAGLDPNVLDFLPYGNSGILIFTPQHPAATIAASDIVKAILFRSLRIVFGKGSTFYDLPGTERYYRFINDLLDRVEDVYDPAIGNLDSFLRELREALGDHPILHAIRDTLESFRVYYVLNMFNEVEEGYEHAVVPFLDNLTENVSARLNLTQLGWIVEDQRLHDANCAGFPIVLDRRRPEPTQSRERESEGKDPVMAELEELESSMLGVERRRAGRSGSRSRSGRSRRSPDPPPETGDLLEGQLQILKAMYSDRKKDTVKENFSYITYRSLNLMTAGYGPNEFGLTRLAAPEQLLEWYMSRQMV